MEFRNFVAIIKRFVVKLIRHFINIKYESNHNTSEY